MNGSGRNGTLVARALVASLLGVACRPHASPSGGDANATSPALSSARGPTGSVRPDAAAGVEADAEAEAAAAPCVIAALQPGRCVPPPGPVKRELVVRWFTDRGVADASDLRRLDSVADEGCEEVSFGSSNERVLACVMDETLEVDPSLHGSGPVQLNMSLGVLTVRDHRLAELALVPIGVASSESLLFRARHTLNGEARSLDVVVDEEDCRAADARLGTYWEEKIAEVRRSSQPTESKRLLVHAHQLERRTGASRIAAICRAAGHYVEARGRLVKSADKPR